MNKNKDVRHNTDVRMNMRKNKIVKTRISIKSTFINNEENENDNENNGVSWRNVIERNT